jgi:hypothetical protein
MEIFSISISLESGYLPDLVSTNPLVRESFPEYIKDQFFCHDEAFPPTTFPTPSHNSKRVNKIRPRITQLLNLSLRLPLNPRIPPTARSLLILIDQQKPLEQTAAQEEQSEIGQDGAMAGQESRRILAAVDIGGDDAVEVAPADDEANGDAALVDAFDVVGRPGDCVADAGIDAEGAEVDACVLN